MRYHSVAAVFLLVFIFGVQYAFMLGVGINREPHWWGTKLPKGCYTFVGKVQCHGNAPILPGATVSIWDYDKMADPNDKVTTAPVNPDGTYKVHGCAEDYYVWIPQPNVELFLRFYDVCRPGDWYDNRYPDPDVDQTWKLYMYRAHWAADNPPSNGASSDGFQLSPLNKRIKPGFNRRMLAHYPRMPRPYSDRISNGGDNFYWMNKTNADGEGNSSMPYQPRPYYYNNTSGYDLWNATYDAGRNVFYPIDFYPHPPRSRPYYYYNNTNGDDYGRMNSTLNEGLMNGTDTAAEHISRDFVPRFHRRKYHPQQRPYGGQGEYEYPPQPRPEHRRRRHLQQQNNRLMGHQNVYNVRPKRTILAKATQFTFKGRVECYSPEYGITPVVDSSKVKLMEWDFWNSDDLITTQKIKQNGEFEISGQDDEGWAWADVDLYLRFENVCWYGDSYNFDYPWPNDYTHIRLNSNGRVDARYQSPTIHKYIRG